MSKSKKTIKYREMGLVIIILGLFFEVLLIILMIISIFSSGKYVGYSVAMLFFFCFMIIPGLLVQYGVKTSILKDIFILFFFTFFIALVGSALTIGIYVNVYHTWNISERMYLSVFLGSFAVGFIISIFITLGFHISR